VKKTIISKDGRLHTSEAPSEYANKKFVLDIERSKGNHDTLELIPCIITSEWGEEREKVLDQIKHEKGE
jgi:hypothetical protein